jgi:hypothetical protein
LQVQRVVWKLMLPGTFLSLKALLPLPAPFAINRIETKAGILIDTGFNIQYNLEI